MKIILSILIFASLSLLKRSYNQSVDVLIMSNSQDQTIFCPASDEKVKIFLQEYLNKESVRKQLTDDHGLDLASFTNDEMIALEGEANRNECEKFLERMPGIGDLDSYSFYKIRNHFFLARYYATGQM